MKRLMFSKKPFMTKRARFGLVKRFQRGVKRGIMLSRWHKATYAPPTRFGNKLIKRGGFGYRRAFNSFNRLRKY